MYYVCDNCGALETTDETIPEDGDWACGVCGCRAAWEFDNHENAYAHAMHIRKLYKSRLFGRVGS